MDPLPHYEYEALLMKAVNAYGAGRVVLCRCSFSSRIAIAAAAAAAALTPCTRSGDLVYGIVDALRNARFEFTWYRQLYSLPSTYRCY